MPEGQASSGRRGRRDRQDAAGVAKFDRDFAAEAVRLGLVTRAQLDEALRERGTIPGPGIRRSLAEIMVERGLITEVQAERVRLAVKTGGEPRIVGGFELIGKLGEGAMGVVYKARQISLDRTVALKILPERLVHDRRFVARFKREAKVAAKLDHVNVVRALDVGEAAGVRYFAMEFVEGRDVGSILDERGAMLEREALRITIQIARALEHAWKHSLIHRDIKPDNILVTTDGVAKLADLGLARSTDAEGTRLTATGTAIGTPHYISPEQARGEADVDIRTDIYSLGVTLYHMLVGQLPFSGPSAAVTITRRLTEDPPCVRDAAPETSEGTALVVRKMMAREVDDRYANPSELIRDLELVADGKMPSATARDEETVLWSSGSLKRPGEPRAPEPKGEKSRSPATIAAIVFALLAAAALAFLAWQRGERVRTATVTPELSAKAEEKAAETDALVRQGDAPRSLARQRELEAAQALAEIAALRGAGRLDEALERAAVASDQYADTTRAVELDEDLLALRLAKRKRDEALEAAAELHALRKLVERGEFETAVAGGESAMKKYAGGEYAAKFERVVREAKEASSRARRFEAHVRAAEEALRQKRHADAVAAYEKALAARESDEVRRALRDATYEMHLALSREAEEKGEFPRAIEEVQTAIAIVPTRTASSRLGELERRARLAAALDEARRHEKAGSLERAREAYRRALADATPAARVAISEALHRSEREIAYATAIEEAGTHVAAERWADAERAAKRALKAKPGDAAATALIASVRRAIAAALDEARRHEEASSEAAGPKKTPAKRPDRKPEPEPPPAYEPVRMTNKIGMAFVLVLAGEFTIGDALGQPDEQPVREVTLDAFFIGAHEVTNLQYEQFDRRHRRRRSVSSPDDDHPVVNVSWSHAYKFCNWLTKTEGATYRLPAEAEWEAAARGGEARRFPWGDGAADAGGVYRANWGQGDDRSAWGRDRFLYAAPVGSFPAGASPFGCLDMAGNVWEWCLDWYGASAYAKLPTDNPRGPRRGREKVIRGGSYANDIEIARSSNRQKMNMKTVDPTVGFRVVRELDPKKDGALLDSLAE